MWHWTLNKKLRQNTLFISVILAFEEAVIHFQPANKSFCLTNSNSSSGFVLYLLGT